jgi:hypothetical protein
MKGTEVAYDPATEQPAHRSVVLPVILAYTIAVYWIFRGKVAPDATSH